MKESPPLVSIIVVSYNHARYICESLDSIKNQCYSNIQLILGDDASHDASVTRFDSWLEKNAEVAEKVYNKVNVGFATTLNRCLEKVEGEFVKVLAADDYLGRSYISQCVEYLVKENRDAVFTNAFEIDASSCIVNDSFFAQVSYNTIEDMTSQLVEGNFVPGSTLFLRRQFLLDFGPIPADVLLEDYHFALSLAKKKSFIGYINESLVYYRRHDYNITQTRFHRLEVATLKEQIDFDESGHYRKIVNRNIRRQIYNKNPLVSTLLPRYRIYAGMKMYMLAMLKLASLIEYYKTSSHNK